MPTHDVLCIWHITDESAGYTIFSQPCTKEIHVNTVILSNLLVKESTAGADASVEVAKVL